MIKTSLILLSFLVHLFSMGQEDSLNQTVNGMKEGHWIKAGTDQSCTTCKLEEGVYRNNRKQGDWVHYFPDGKTIRMKIVYLNGRPNGNYETYHENGNLKEIGTFVRNKYRGSLKRYFPSGCIQYEANYTEEGKEHGIITYYFDCIDSTTHPAGPVEFRYEREDGIEIDTARRYYKNGNLRELIIFKEGEEEKREQFERINPRIGPDPTEPIIPRPRIIRPISPDDCRRYDSNKQIIFEGECKNGTFWQGKYYVYDENGILIKIEIWKDGRYHSDGVLEF